MPDEPLTLDELLERQESGPGSLLATVEAVPDRPEHVRVTPFRGDGGCRCSQALVLPRSVVGAVTPTGQEHRCCRGGRLLVVELEVTDPTVAEILRQLAAHDEPGAEPDPRATGSPGGRGWDRGASWAHEPGVPVDPRAFWPPGTGPRARWYAPEGAYPPPVPASDRSTPSRAVFQSTEELATGQPEGRSTSRFSIYEPCYRAWLECDEGCRSVWPGPYGGLRLCRCLCDHGYRRCHGEQGPFEPCYP